jgi:galactokinase/mevalonate kinase-like predicted kinase
MCIQLRDGLLHAQEDNVLPCIVAYNRIDGPGSSLDLREFQQAFWTLPQIPVDLHSDQSATWSCNLPRTIGITIDVGTRIEAVPYIDNKICVQSVDYDTNVESKSGEVFPAKENWLLKIMDIFKLSGVKLILKNLRPGVQSSGLGGSASVTAGVCILANELAGNPFSETQLIAMASRIEQDLGVSITGTQEQSNVLFGGVTDYLWFPWGVPGRADTGYGESIRFELIPPEDYHQLEERMAIFHLGFTHVSSDVNSVWRAALLTRDGFKSLARELKFAYLFREGLRLRKWNQVLESVKKYREIRTSLCKEYMEGSMDILDRAESKGCTAFPLGAGGGGGVLVVSPNPLSLWNLKKELNGSYREISFRIKPKGHEIFNLPP